MNSNPSNTYTSNSRAAKGFEIVGDNPALVDANFNIPTAEVTRVFGANMDVPEGTIVMPYTVGTTVGTYTSVAGDLKIVTNGYDEFWGVTLRKVKYFDSKNNRMDYPETVGYGERVAVATGMFNAVTQNFNVNGQTIQPGARMYAGVSGMPTIDDGTLYVGGYGSGRLFASIMEEGFIEYDVRTGNPKVAASGGVADEIYIKAFCDKLGRI